MKFVWRFYGILKRNSQDVSGKYEQSTQTPWRAAQCTYIGSRPALLLANRYDFNHNVSLNVFASKVAT